MLFNVSSEHCLSFISKQINIFITRTALANLYNCLIFMFIRFLNVNKQAFPKIIISTSPPLLYPQFPPFK